MRGGVVVVAALLCAALLCPAGVASAQAPLPPDQALSANVQTFVNYFVANKLDTSASYLSTMAASGWTGARGDAFWYRVEPTVADVTKPDKWKYFDELKAKYDAGGVRWQPILEGSPNWARDEANPGHSLQLPSENHYPDFARFAAEFAARYGPGGAQAGAFPVQDIEIYNEENAPGAGAHSDPAVYARLYQQARAAIHAVQPSIRVVVGAILYDSDAPTDADYIKSIFATLGGTGADAIGLHPYSQTAVGVVRNIRRMKDGLVAAGQADLPIYVNELGYPAALDGTPPMQHAIQGATTDEARAGTVTLLTDALLASDCNVRDIAYFDLVNQENNVGQPYDYLSSETWKGLERRNGAALTLTGQAYRDAGARWRTNPVQGAVHVCGPTAGPQTKPLPLELKVDRPSPLCLRPTITYRGFPLEDASFEIRKISLKTGSSRLTDATGHLGGDFCVDEATTYFVQAEAVFPFYDVPAFAQSLAYTCNLATTSSCAVVAGSGPGGANNGQGNNPNGEPTASGLSVGGDCLLRSFKVVGSTKLKTVLKRGLKLKASGCLRVARTDVTPRKVKVTVTLNRRTAKTLGFARKLPKKATSIAAGSKSTKGTKDLTVTVKFSKKARALLVNARRVKLGLAVSVTEGKLKRSAKRSVTLTR
jgi:hypothetical protein